MKTFARVLDLLALSTCSLTSAQAQLIRPDSATASSEFSSGYVVNNAINGSGLPANFTLANVHATYASGNHWTTAGGQSIGAFATFTFNSAQGIGVFHYWPHRSNGVASNQFYEATLYDLTLYDGPNATGTVLAQYQGLTGAVDRDTVYSQPIVFQAGVLSVRYTVRATQNNSSSPYTGLAKVAFGACLAPDRTQFASPAPVGTCPGGAATFAVTGFGTGPMTYRWRKDTVLIDTSANPSAATSTLVLTGVTALDAGLYDCVVTNACGNDTSISARLTVGCNTIANIVQVGGGTTCDDQLTADDIVAFLSGFFANQPVADVARVGGSLGADGRYTADDVIAFLGAFFAGCP